MLRKRGVTIALLGYDDFHPRSFEASPGAPGVAWAEEPQIVVYSLGNFVFDLVDQPENALGWRLRLVVDRGGVVSFSTASVRIDDDGAPFPMPGAASPCGARGDSSVSSCQGQARQRGTPPFARPRVELC